MPSLHLVGQGFELVRVRVDVREKAQQLHPFSFRKVPRYQGDATSERIQAKRQV